MSLSRLAGRTLLAFAACTEPLQAYAQISLQSIVALAVQNSPRVKMSQDDLDRSKASLSESKDAYIPTLGLGGGLGRSYGISLTVPTIFTLNSQSLVYSPAQRHYVRAAHDAVDASEHALQDVREQVEEDSALTYITLDEALARKKVLADELVVATKLYDITQQRNAAGIESDLEVKRSMRTMLQIELQQPQVENDVAAMQEHLSELTGLTGPIDTLPDSVPARDASQAAPKSSPSTPSAATLSSQANARARAETAAGDLRYAFRPQVLMQAQYGRISPINDVSEYYNLNGRYNTMAFGVSIQLPLFDKAHAARSREAAADALHAQHEAQFIEGQQREFKLKLQNSLSELSIKVELTRVDWEIAKDQLALTSTEAAKPSADITGGRQVTAKDELGARLEEAQRHLDWLEATLQLHRTRITIARLNGDLEDWLGCSSAASAPCAPAIGSPSH